MRGIAVFSAISRLGSFKAAATELSDITIRYGDAARWSETARPLLKEVVQPYCAPNQLQRRKSIPAKTLLSRPLIQSRENAVSWEAWFRQRGLHFDTSGLQLIQIDPSYVAIEAAVNGVGVILESSILTATHVKSGRLVAPVREPHTPATAYWLMPLRRGTRDSVELAHAWLIEQARQTVQR